MTAKTPGSNGVTFEGTMKFSLIYKRRGLRIGARRSWQAFWPCRFSPKPRPGARFAGQAGRRSPPRHFHPDRRQFPAAGRGAEGREALRCGRCGEAAYASCFLVRLAGRGISRWLELGLPDSKTKAEAWSNHEDFVKKLKEFQGNAAALQKVNSAEKAGNEAFKTARSRQSLRTARAATTTTRK